WETCMTMNDTWGFKRNDHNWKSTEDLIRKLADIASKGGNFLLNVGPTALGEIPRPSIERLQAIGRWMDVNAQSIYGTSASPFKRLPWGRCTCKTLSADRTLLYLHVFDWPEDARLVVPGLENVVLDAYLLADADRESLAVAHLDDGLVITVPPAAPDPIDTVVVLEITGEPEVAPYIIRPAADGTITLPAIEAAIHGSTARYESGGGKDNIGYWSDPADQVSWLFHADQPGRYDVYLTYACEAGSGGGTFHLRVGSGELAGRIEETGSWTAFRELKIGEIVLDGPGPHKLLVAPAEIPGQALMNLRSVSIRPIAGGK
ncbi:MAG: alpha-L-fucosidase, partial [Phycisphaerales bacterium]